MRSWRILHGDCFERLRELEAESVDASVTDPPYGIGFMGKEWDTFRPDVTRELRARTVKNHKATANPNLKGRLQWAGGAAVEYDYSVTGQRGFQAWTEQWARAAFRVLKPGAYAVVCGAPRSYHRMACGLEDAGFEIRDCFSWLFGSGFPKSLNLGDGRGTALKPGYEPIVLARKPFKGSLTKNVEAHGTGALNIDACRIGEPEDKPFPVSRGYRAGGFEPGVSERELHDVEHDGLGRWPANVLLDEEAAALLDEQSGELQSGFMAEGTPRRPDETTRNVYGVFSGSAALRPTYADTGGASRFYYVAKPSREERDFGIYDLAQKSGGEATDRKDGSAGLNNPRAGAGRTGGGRNFHPTVKPVDLMRWLVRLVTPPGGVVLDPFTGSGTTGMACRYEHRSFIGIEREADYIAIAERRIHAVAPLFSEAR